MNGKRVRQLRAGASGKTSRDAKRRYTYGRTASAQAPKLSEPRQRRPKEQQPMGSSEWRRRGPLIVVKPWRQTHVEWRGAYSWEDRSNTGIKSDYGALPKHSLDALALTYPAETWP